MESDPIFNESISDYLPAKEMSVDSPTLNTYTASSAQPPASQSQYEHIDGPRPGVTQSQPPIEHVCTIVPTEQPHEDIQHEDTRVNVTYIRHTCTATHGGDNTIHAPQGPTQGLPTNGATGASVTPTLHFTTARAAFSSYVPDGALQDLLSPTNVFAHKYAEWDGSIFEVPDFGPDPFLSQPQPVPELRGPISTPFSLEGFTKALENHPNAEFREYTLGILRDGADLGVRDIERFGNKGVIFANAQSALENAHVVDAWLDARLQEGAVVPIRNKGSVRHMYFSRLAVSLGSKKRIVSNFSHPHQHSLNDCIDREQTSLCYPGIGALSDAMQRWPETNVGLGADVRSAFHNVAVRSNQRHLLGFQWRGNIYACVRLALGIRSASKIYASIGLAINFHITNSLLRAGLENQFLIAGLPATGQEITDKLGILPLVYADDHHVCCANEQVAKQAFPIVDQALADLTIPHAIEKDARGTKLTFIGFVADYHNKTLEVKPSKRESIIQRLEELKTAGEVHAQHGRSIIGTLIYVAQLTRGLNPFLTTLNATVHAALRQWRAHGRPSVRLGLDTLDDIDRILQYLQRFPLLSTVPDRVAFLVTDASAKYGNGGAGYLLDRQGSVHWLAYKHPRVLSMQDENGDPITGTLSSSALVECLAVAAMVIHHQDLLRNTTVYATLDAQAAIGALKGFRSHRTPAINLVLKTMAWPMGEAGIILHARWCTRESSLIMLADHLSRSQVDQFLAQCPAAQPQPSLPPDQLPPIISQLAAFLQQQQP